MLEQNISTVNNDVKTLVKMPRPCSPPPPR
jgi:hypothetical protein